MFSFFTKKNFIVDHLAGFIDIHNHILPGIDDGAKDVEESIAILQEFSNLGVKRFVATPHIMHDYYPNDSETISKSLASLKKALLEKGVTDVFLEAAAEHMIDSNFESLLERGGTMPLKEDYLLIEMSYLQPSINFDYATDRIMSKGYFPILAHPERYIYLQKRTKNYNEYKRKGVRFQLNLLSLGEYYGKEVQQTTFKLLNEGLIDYLASDVHSLIQMQILKELKISDKILDKLLPKIEATIYDFY